VQLRRHLETIERARGSRVLVVAATNLDLDLLPVLHERLGDIAQAGRLDVLLYCRGGQIGAARRIAMLLHDFAGRLSFIVPDRCESAGTLLALAGIEILASPVAVFSPVDPQLQTTAAGDSGPGAIAAEDVRLFGEMAERWFGIASEEAGANALSMLSASIFPTTLAAFYRATLEVEGICAELLALGIPDSPAEARAAIGAALIRGHHSHGFPLAPSDLAAIGLPVQGDAAIATPAMAIARALRGSVGASARRSEEEGWTDALFATVQGWSERRRLPGAPGPDWVRGETE
jgi:hypothetical protein